MSHRSEKPMKNLILIRHAKSSWDNPAWSDLERPLNKRGKRDAPIMGRLMKEQGLLPDLILTSPARRARKTASKIAKEVGYPKEQIIIAESIYLQGTTKLIELIGTQNDETNRIFLIGHNPEMTELASHLTRSNIDNVPTCGIVSIEFPFDSWRRVSEEAGILTLFERPRHPAEE